MFHFTNINRHKPAPQCAEPLVLCSEMNLIRIRSMYERKHPTNWDMSHYETLCFATSDFPKTIRYQEDKNLRPKAKEPHLPLIIFFKNTQILNQNLAAQEPKTFSRIPKK